MKFHFDKNKPLIVMNVKFESKERIVESKLALDTGATKTIISWEIAILLGKDPASIQEKHKIITGSGLEWCPAIVIDSVETIGKRVKNLKTLCHNLPPSSRIDGLLGLNFFKNIDLRINFKKAYVEFK